MGKCRDCKFWYRGEKVHYSETSVQWDGKPHPSAGKILVKRSWGNFVPNEGECRGVFESIKSPRLPITYSHFGCCEYVFDDGAEKFDHVYVDHRGQQSLEDYKVEMAKQPEFEAPLGVTWQTKEKYYGDPNVGIVHYPKSAAEPIVLEPKVKHETRD